MNTLTKDAIQYLGIVIALFSVVSIVQKGSIVFYVTCFGAIIFSIFTIISAWKLITSSLKKR